MYMHSNVEIETKIQLIHELHMNGSICFNSLRLRTKTVDEATVGEMNIICNNRNYNKATTTTIVQVSDSIKIDKKK